MFCQPVLHSVHALRHQSSLRAIPLIEQVVAGMKSTVYFAGIRARCFGTASKTRSYRLFGSAGFSKAIRKGYEAAIKIHFGELSNDSYVSPVLKRLQPC